MRPMRVDRRFFDTDVLVYAFIGDRRSQRALTLLEKGGAIGVQNLNEFANVARNKLKKDWNWIHEALDRIRFLCPTVVPMDVRLHRKGIAIADRLQLNIFDALVVAAAREQGCETLWSEDMQDGMVVDALLTIRNPFTNQPG